MKASELRTKSREELQASLEEELKKQFKMRMNRATGQMEQTHELKQVRRQIARIKTVLNENAGS
ncbi:MAG TPA: 50S ribosomal protein L29 [Porticoccaceae bacterium]|nr:50S ribosomal protein L29 [Porticoccaceae bacterium]HCO58700.1 50S ribosomal protein L29 [Porticoccaceae bacterium]